MEYQVYLIPANNSRAVWPRVKKHLKPAIKASAGRWKPEYVLAGLVLGEQTLWAVVDAEGTCVGAATTEIMQYPEKNMLAIHFLGGADFDGWYPRFHDDLVHYARTYGCTGIECLARTGFWKWFKHDGFQKTAVMYEKLV